jgi:hypothetical protein
MDVLLVSACDKLHNAGAIVADLRNPNVGSAVWKRFNKGKKDQLWYYGCLATTYNGRVKSSLSDELNRVVKEMGSLGSISTFA